MSDGRNVGSRIAEIRKKKGLTQEYVAGMLGKTPQWLSNIEREIRPISADELAILATILEVDPGIFFTSKFNKMLRNNEMNPATGTEG